MSASVDFARLRSDPYWRKKFRRFLETTDVHVDRDGYVYVCRADHELYVARYRSLTC